MPALMSSVKVRFPRPTPWTTRHWIAYFERRRLLPIPWARGPDLTECERRTLIPSLQVFQQGEAQDGGHFYCCVREYAEASGDLDYIEAHRLFMLEEKRHGRDLGRFLRLNDILLLTEPSPLTCIFCWCGSRGGLETMLRVIVICEILALVYYAAVRRATHSSVLRRLCAQILRDEKQHIRFQCERLAIIRMRRSRLQLFGDRAVDRLLFEIALAILWFGHRRLLRVGGYGLIGLRRRASEVFRAAGKRINPRRDPSL